MLKIVSIYAIHITYIFFAIDFIFTNPFIYKLCFNKRMKSLNSK